MRIDWKPNRARALRQAQGAALRPLGGLGALQAQTSASSVEPGAALRPLGGLGALQAEGAALRQAQGAAARSA